MYIQLGHSARITSVAVAPDNSLVLTGSEDQTVKLWSLSAEKEMKTFYGHYEPVSSVSFSPDGILAVSGGLDSRVIVWNLASGKSIAEITTPFPGMKVRCAVFSPSGDRILSGGSEDPFSGIDHFADNSDTKNGIIHLWDYKKPGKPLLTLTGDFYEIYNLSFSDDGQYVLSTGGNGFYIQDLLSIPSLSIDMVEDIRKRRKSEIILWNIKNGTQICTFYSALEYNNDPIVSSEGAFSLIAYKDRTIKIINTGSKKEFCSINGHTEYIENCIKTGDNRFELCGENNMLVKRDLVTGKDMGGFARYSRTGIEDVQFSQELCMIIARDNDGFTLWDLSLGRKSLAGKLYPWTKAVFSPDGKKILLQENDHSFKIVTKESENTEKIFSTDTGKIACTVFSPDGRKVLSGGRNRKTGNGEILVWEPGTDKPGIVLPGTYGSVGALAFDTTGNLAVSGGLSHNQDDYSKTGEIILWDLKKAEILKRFEYDSYDVHEVRFSPDAKYILSSGDIFKDIGVIKLWDVRSGKEVITFSRDIHTLESIAFSPDGSLLVTGGSDGHLKIFKMNGLQETAEYSGHTKAVNSVCFSRNGNFLLSGSSDKTIILRDAANGNVLKTFTGHSDSVTKAVLTPGNNFVISGSKDTTTRVWNIKTGEYTCLVSGSESNEWIIYTNDGYWDSSRNGGSLIAMVRGIECWNVDQFALINNRPDIIIKRFCGKGGDVINHYYHQYLKRLKRLGLSEQDLKKDYNVPVVKTGRTVQTGKFFTIDCDLYDTSYDLRSYTIHLNDVPLFGSFGKPITGKSGKFTEKIELISGENKIEISCMNSNGTESFRSLLYANYDKKVNTDLYFIGFGVSQYKNQDLNLKYADKDVRDLSDLFLQMKGGMFRHVYIRTYLNSEVTQDAIKKSREFLLHAAPDDTFVLFISGHGVHDKDSTATYYFLTHNTDLSNLPRTAADFEFIEGILQGIPPRNKLFLMDTCESGEIDDTVQDTYYKQADSRGLRARTIRYDDSPPDSRGTLILKKTPKRTYLFEKDRFIYNDLVRRSGAIVFSSCLGGEFSYEKQEIENGFFTEAILQGFLTGQADKNRDKTIDIEELKEYVSRTVAEATGNLQHPTVDRDNLYQKFGFPLADMEHLRDKR